MKVTDTKNINTICKIGTYVECLDLARFDDHPAAGEVLVAILVDDDPFGWFSLRQSSLGLTGGHRRTYFRAINSRGQS